MICYALIAYQLLVYAIVNNFSELINEENNFCLSNLG